MKIVFPLSKSDKQTLLSQGKLIVERSEPLGRFVKGDYLEIEGRIFVVSEVHRSDNSKRKRFAYSYTFRSQKELAVFHVHEFHNGECIHCGFIPETIEANE